MSRNSEIYSRKFSVRQTVILVVLLRLFRRDILLLSIVIIPPIRADTNRRVDSLTISKDSRFGVEFLSFVVLNKSFNLVKSVKLKELLSESDNKLDESRAEFS